jgi:hypothetical protein
LLAGGSGAELEEDAGEDERRAAPQQPSHGATAAQEPVVTKTPGDTSDTKN